ncbi:hypothetical protein [Agrobacterium pusense]|uniref:hypothetical protein n=1 Tax=Agrobacterium pusense TaxID=648995 RepID=UPI00289FFA10|nr:hypothetical protein [Agrobacterium pusense]
MTPSRLLLAIVPATIMCAATIVISGIEQWMAAFGTTGQAKLVLGRIGLALPYALAAGVSQSFSLTLT